MMMNTAPPASLLRCLLMVIACGAATAGTPHSRLTPHETAFLKTASACAALEIRLSGLAVRQGGTVVLKAYAGMLIQDQRRFMVDVKPFAELEIVPLNVVMRAEDIVTLHRVETCELAQFDALFLDVMLHSHEATLAAFEAQALDITSHRLKPFVKQVIPLLRAHRDMVAWLSMQ